MSNLVSHIQGEHKLSVFENEMLKDMSRTKGSDLTGAWRRLHNEQLHDLYSTARIACDQMWQGEMEWTCGMYMAQGRCILCFGGET